MKNQPFRFHFQPVDREHRSLVHRWLKEPHVAKWFYGQGLQNTFNHLDDFLNGSIQVKYWLGYDQKRPFAFLITSSVEKPDDQLTNWCSKKGEAITLDFLIGETDYLGKGLSHIVIQEFLLGQFPHVAEVLIDPEATNSHAIHIYKKIGFTILDEFIPSHSPHPHYMMRLDMQELANNFYHVEPYDTVPHQEVLFIASEKERKAALEFRQKHFFDRLNIQDPYAWALDKKDHLHWLLYDGNEVIGYAHVQMWPDHRGALRIIVIDEQKRGSGMGKYLIDHCERELKQRGVTLLQTEASPNAYLFYKKLGYIDMPFHNPDGEATHPDDRAIGKYL